MPSLVARYGGFDLAVIDVVNGVPYVFHDGQVRPATDVTLGRESLTSIDHAPQFVPVYPGGWADLNHAGADGTMTRGSFPVVALKLDPGLDWGEAVILTGDGFNVARHESVLGYRLGQPGPYCSYDEEA